MKNKKVKSLQYSASERKNQKKLLTEMDTDEILAVYGSHLTGRERREIKKGRRMKVSGQSVFKIKAIMHKFINILHSMRK